MPYQRGQRRLPSLPALRWVRVLNWGFSGVYLMSNWKIYDDMVISLLKLGFASIKHYVLDDIFYILMPINE